MNAFFAASRLSEDEKEDILKKHRTLYDGYRTMQSQVPNEQPLYVQDFAKDKLGAVLNNKGVAKPYTNVGINEQVEEVCDECGAMQMSEEKGMCSECGGMMQEGECSECGWKGEVGAMEESNQMCSECGGMIQEGECSECGYKMEELDETGHLDDIYNVEDLGNGEFDYVEGGGNDYGTFEKMHHMKGIKNEQIEDGYEDPDNEDDGFEDIQASEELDELGSNELKKGGKYKFKSPSFEDEIEYDDDFEDKSGGEKMFKFKGQKATHLMPSKSIEDFVSGLDEQGYTGGGNAPDMDLSNIEPAYDFVSNGPGDVYPTEGEMDEEYETMESAWSEDLDENDISGVQGIYGDMEPAFDFDSEGPGKAGPYQTSSWNEEYEGEDEDVYWEKDLEPNELDLDLTKFNPEDKSWEEIKAHTGNWDEIDEDLRESFITKKNKVMEMMLRMKVIK